MQLVPQCQLNQCENNIKLEAIKKLTYGYFIFSSKHDIIWCEISVDDMFLFVQIS